MGENEGETVGAFVFAGTNREGISVGTLVGVKVGTMEGSSDGRPGAKGQTNVGGLPRSVYNDATQESEPEQK